MYSECFKHDDDGCVFGLALLWKWAPPGFFATVASQPYGGRATGLGGANLVGVGTRAWPSVVWVLSRDALKTI